MLAFGAYVARVLGFAPARHDLAAALGAVRFVPKQAGAKLSPTRRSNRRGPSGRRVGPVAVHPFTAVSYASFSSCPSGCVFMRDPITGKPGGCFAEAHVDISERVMKVRDASAALIRDDRLRGVLIGMAEAYIIDTAFPRGVPQDGARGGRDLRLHVAGDVADARVARALADAAVRWSARGGGQVWTYTHRWRTIPRSAWGAIAVLASCETDSDVVAARGRGYAVAVTAASFGGRPYLALPGIPGARLRVCPHEYQASRDVANPVTCSACRACFDDQRLRDRNELIGFLLHGTEAAAGAESVREAHVAEAVVRRHLPVVG